MHDELLSDEPPAPRIVRWWWVPAVLAAFLTGWVGAHRLSDLRSERAREARDARAAAAPADPTAEEAAIDVEPVTTPAPAAATQAYGRTFTTRDGVTLDYDVRWPNGLPNLPSVLVLHGGGWWSGDKTDPLVVAVAITLQRAGFVVISANYRLSCGDAETPRSVLGTDFRSDSPLCGATIPVQVADVVDLVAHVRESGEALRVDPKRVTLMGMSAGGHLAMLAAAEPGVEPKAVVNWSGPPDVDYIQRQPVRPTGKHDRTIRPSFTNAVGCDLATCPRRWASASPVDAIVRARLRAPIMSVAGAQESQVPFSELARFHVRLTSLRIPNLLYAGTGECHGAGCATQLLERGDATALDATIAFLQRAIRVTSAPARTR